MYSLLNYESHLSMNRHITCISVHGCDLLGLDSNLQGYFAKYFENVFKLKLHLA